MRRRTALSLVGSVAVAGCAGGTTSEPTDGSATADPTVETVATGFTHPWAVEPLPGGSSLLVTERPGDLWLVDATTGDRTRVDGTPEVVAEGQGGLLDATVGPSYPREPWLYLTYAVGRPDGTSSTRVGRGRLVTDAPRLDGFAALYTAEPFVESSGHFGSRVAFDTAGAMYVTVGDRQFKNFGPDHVAQDPTNDLGTTLRLRPDGSVPEDNPFVDRRGNDAVFSYGHRNSQGLAIQPGTGAVWATEFGEKDGDEINVLRAGGNYGWPVADESCRYGTNEPVGVSHADRDDVVAPVHSWPCGSGGFPPSGATFYEGRHSPWRGDLFVGGLASRALAHLHVDRTRVTEVDPMLADRGWRVRDVANAPDGALYVAVDADDAPVARVTP